MQAEQISHNSEMRSRLLCFASSVPHICWGFSGLAGPASLSVSVAVEREPICSRLSSTISPEANTTPKWKLFNYLFYRENPVTELNNWLNEGNRLKATDLRSMVWRLRLDKQYVKALQVSGWMQNKNFFEFAAADYAIQLDLIAKVHGIDRAENYFLYLPEFAKNECTYCTLLYHYAKRKLTEKAEKCMEKIKELGLAKNAVPFNWIMLLYMANGQVEKVPLMVKQLKELDIQPDSRTYCLWISACSAVPGCDVEKIVNAIKSIDDYNLNWHIYSTLANIYIKSGLVDKAQSALKELENKITRTDPMAYNHLITMHASLGNKEEVHRIWGSLKINLKKIRDQSYKSVLSSLVKVGDIEGAEKIFEEWLSSRSRHDCKVSNILLAAYVRKGMLEMAETFHERIIEKGGIPKCRTWEILCEGYLESNQMDKAVITMMKALSKVKSNEWQPCSKNIMAILKYFEKHGNIECVDEFLMLLRHIRFVTTEIYNSLISTYVKAGKTVSKLLEHMVNDNVKADEETERLLFDVIIS